MPLEGRRKPETVSILMGLSEFTGEGAWGREGERERERKEERNVLKLERHSHDCCFLPSTQ